MSAEDIMIPPYIERCPLVFDWVTYKGEVYFAALNYERSQRAKRAMFDLHYCATAALNGNLIEKTVAWHPDKFVINPERKR